jgi:hypothetical protein
MHQLLKSQQKMVRGLGTYGSSSPPGPALPSAGPNRFDMWGLRGSGRLLRSVLATERALDAACSWD